MFAIERRNKIKERLFRDKRVDVFELSEMFSVTEATIRRDLDKLEQQGYLVKIYGGAVLKEDESAVSDRLREEQEDETIEEKRLIGKIASQLVENGEAIFIGPGSTCLEIAKNIKDKRVTVVTNDMRIAYELKDSSSVKLMVTGGDLMTSMTTLVGGFALRALEGIYVNKSFIGVKGVHLESGYTVSSYEEALVLQSVMKISKENIIVADYTKFDKVGFAKLGDFSISEKLITNKQVPSSYKQYTFEHGIRLYTAYEFE